MGSKATETKAGYEKNPQFGGPNSIGAQLKFDDELKKTGVRDDALHRLLKPYFDFKDRVAKEYGVAFGIDFNALIQTATESLGEDTAAGGVVRFFGQWAILGRSTENTGVLGFRIENRHRLGTDIAPEDLSAEIGYVGQTATGYTDKGWLLTNLFWHQQFLDNRVGFTAGVVDTFDYVDTYSMLNRWTDFLNKAFLASPTIALPEEGLGVAAHAMVTDHLYVLGGLANASADPSDPWQSYKSFFDDTELFTHLEVGWIPNLERRYTDSIHLTAWLADTRTEDQVPSGWGLAFSFNHLFADKWEPFVRAGYSEGGGALWERSVIIGLGYHTRKKGDFVALGLNWGRPSEKAYGPGLDDQYTAELFYRHHLLQNLAITPDVQFLINPALNPEEDRIWIFGLRARLAF